MSDPDVTNGFGLPVGMESTRTLMPQVLLDLTTRAVAAGSLPATLEEASAIATAAHRLREDRTALAQMRIPLQPKE